MLNSGASFLDMGRNFSGKGRRVKRILGSGTVWWDEAADEPAREDAHPAENETEPLRDFGDASAPLKPRFGAARWLPLQRQANGGRATEADLSRDPVQAAVQDTSRSGPERRPGKAEWASPCFPCLSLAPLPRSCPVSGVNWLKPSLIIMEQKCGRISACGPDRRSG